MKTIWKYPLRDMSTELRLPAQALILSVINQKNVPTLYALVDTDPNYEELWEVDICGTGWERSELNHEHYVGTVSTHDGDFVWHVFAEKVGVAK